MFAESLEMFMTYRGTCHMTSQGSNVSCLSPLIHNCRHPAGKPRSSQQDVPILIPKDLLRGPTPHKMLLNQSLEMASMLDSCDFSPQ